MSWGKISDAPYVSHCLFVSSRLDAMCAYTYVMLQIIGCSSSRIHRINTLQHWTKPGYSESIRHLGVGSRKQLVALYYILYMLCIVYSPYLVDMTGIRYYL